MPATTVWTAIERRRDIQKAIETFEDKFCRGGLPISGFPDGRTVNHPALGVWGHFRQSGQASPQKYWNVFGLPTGSPSANIVVEINPPRDGRNLNRQGVLAVDGQGHRRLMHQGRIHAGKVRITEEMFDAAAHPERQLVRFEDGRQVECIPVADLDSSAKSVRLSIAAFVEQCAAVKAHYLADSEDADLASKILTAERTLTPEGKGSYELPPMGPRKAERVHADIWAALDRALKRRGDERWNSRFGRLGPDLFARGSDGPVLFEIKPDAAASSIHTALGQLILYEHLSGERCKKVMVLPSMPSVPIMAALEASGIAVLTFVPRGSSFRFDKDDLSSIMD